MENLIKNYILNNIDILDDDFILHNDDNIFKLGFVDSMFAMQLIAFLENQFHINIEEEDMEIHHFNTVRNIINFIHSKKNGTE